MRSTTVVILFLFYNLKTYNMATPVHGNPMIDRKAEAIMTLVEDFYSKKNMKNLSREILEKVRDEFGRVHKEAETFIVIREKQSKAGKRIK